MNATMRASVISEQDFINLGMNDIAYVRPQEVDGQIHFAVHTADGRAALVVPTREMALAAILRNDLEVVPLH